LNGPSLRIHLALIVCFFMMVSGLPTLADVSDPGSGPQIPAAPVDYALPTEIPYDHMLRFNDLEFDPAVGIIDDRFFWYLPNFAFLVSIPDDMKAQVSTHDHVRAVYPYHTAFKVPKDMWTKSLGAQRMDFVAVPLEEEALVAAEIELIGGTVYYYSENEVLFTLRGDMLLDIARLEQVGWVQMFSEPTILNDNYGRTIKVRQQADGGFTDDGESLWSFNSGNFPGDSAGENIIVAVFDTGMDTDHPAYEDTPGDQPKLVWFKDYNDGSENDWHDTGSHGTHTSCTVLGNGKWRASDPGTEGRNTGMAPRARLIGQAGLSINAGTVYTHLNEPLTHGANHTSNSWGDPGSYKVYTALSRNYDIYTRDANTTKAGDQEILSVFAAGNEGNTGPREPAVAKNVLTVGATGNDKGTSSSTVVGFSAKGPTDDGRTKPDIVTPGDGVVSCGTGGTSYRSASGTSMACPGAAGGVAVIRSYWNSTYGYTPSPALTKALVVNGGTPIPGYTYPGGSQGWGRMNVANSVLENATKSIEVLEQQENLALMTGFSVRIPIDVNSAEPIRISLVWTDVAGGPENPKPALVNDLNLKFIAPNEISYWGNRFSGGISTTGGNADNINNVEGIYLPTPITGEWSLRVEGFNIADGPQDFALVVSGDMGMGTPVLEAEDLIPTNLTFTPSDGLVEGDLVTINVDINNNGTRQTSTVRYQWYVDNILADILNFDGDIAAKGKVSIEYSWQAVRGDHEIRLVLDPYNTHFEQNESNNWLAGNLHVDHYGLMLDIEDKRAKKADPGGNTSYLLLVENEGSISDTFTLTHDSAPDGWAADLETDTIEVPPGEIGKVLFTVDAPAKALTTEFARLGLHVVSEGNDTYWKEVTTVTSINQIAALNMSIEQNTSNVAPRGKVSYHFVIYNDGNGLDTVTLTVNHTPWGWFVGLSEYVVVLDPYSSKEMSCVVTAPFNAEAGFEAVASIEGYSTSGVFTHVDLLTTVDRITGMNLSSEAEPVELYPGETTEFPFKLKNDGNGAEEITLTTEVPEGWETNITTDEMGLGPFEMIERTLMLSVPEQELKGDYIITMTADNGTDTMTLEFKVTVNQVFGLEAFMEPVYQNVTKGDDAVYNLSVTNTGNGPDAIEFWLDSNKLLNSKFSNSSVVIVAGETVMINLTINTSYLEFGNFTVPVHVYSTNAQSANADLEAKLEVLEPPPEVPEKPEKPNPPGPIDIIPGKGALTSTWGIILILMLIMLIMIIGGDSAAAYSRYQRLKAERLAEEDGDKISEEYEERPKEPEKLEPTYEEPKSTFSLDTHMAGFGTQDTGTVDETETTEEAYTEETTETTEDVDDEGDDYLLPPQVVDDTVSSQMFGDEAAEADEKTYEEPESSEVQEPGPEESDSPAESQDKVEEKSKFEKEMEEAERSLDDIMKDLDS